MNEPKRGVVLPILEIIKNKETSGNGPITILSFREIVRQSLCHSFSPFTKNQLVSDQHQSAFRSFHSTETNLSDLTSKLL